MSATARVRATTVRVRDHFVLARFGRTAQSRFRAAASEGLRTALTSPGNPWVDFVLFVEAGELLSAMFAAGDLALSREIGAFGAETNMGSWRAIAHRLLSPGTILSLAATFWSHHYDGGRLLVSPGPEGRASSIRVRLEDFPSPHRTHCFAIEGWIERTILLGKPRSARAREVECRLSGGHACDFRAEWET